MPVSSRAKEAPGRRADPRPTERMNPSSIRVTGQVEAGAKRSSRSGVRQASHTTTRPPTAVGARSGAAARHSEEWWAARPVQQPRRRAVLPFGEAYADDAPVVLVEPGRAARRLFRPRLQTGPARATRDPGRPAAAVLPRRRLRSGPPGVRQGALPATSRSSCKPPKTGMPRSRAARPISSSSHETTIFRRLDRRPGG